MKRNFVLLFVLFFLCFQQSAFAQLADVDKGCPPLRVNFTAPGGQTTFFWNLGDGSTSTLRNPVKTYSNPGTYVVTFRANAVGTVLATDTITIYPKPSVSLIADPASGCIPLNVKFTDASTIDPNIVVTGYSWTFGDGSPIATGQMVNHTYNTAGSFAVSLQIESSTPGCTTLKNNPALINASARPVPRIGSVPTVLTACNPPFAVDFSNLTQGSNLDFDWDFGNGSTSTDADPQPVTYLNNGRFTVRLTATDLNGCSASTSVIVNIGSPRAEFNMPDTVCAGVKINIANNSSQGIYFWEFGAGAAPMDTIGFSPTVIFWNEGFYDVKLNVRDFSGNCQSDTSKRIFVDAVDATFASDPTYSCSEPFSRTFTPLSNEQGTFRWNFSDGSTSNLRNPTYVWTNPDTTTYSINGQIFDSTTLTITNANGCEGFFFVVDTIQLPNALFVPDTTMGCAPLTVNFRDSSSSRERIVKWTYLWGDGNSSSFNDDDPVDHTFTQPGEYPVRLVIENERGCTDTSYAILIEVGGPISPDFTVDKTSVCQGDTVRFINLNNDPRIDAWHYSTDGDRMSHCPDERNPYWVFDNETGAMDVTLTVLYNGCASEITKDDLITVSGPLAHIDYKIECETPFEVAFFDSLVYESTDYKWYFGDGDSSTLANPVHTYTAVGDYKVVLVTQNAGSACPESRDTVTVHIRQIKADFELSDNYCIGLNFQLDASKSEGVNANCWKGYTWMFTDNRPITTQDAAIDYAFMGRDSQTVTLIVEDVNGCRDTLERSTRVFKVEADFELDKTRICLPSEVKFTDRSIGDTTIVQWDWEFGDGTQNDQQNPAHTFGTPPMTADTFYIKLVAHDVFDCTGEFTIPISVYEPFSSIQITDQTLCAGDFTIFSATDFTQEGSNLRFEWLLNSNPVSTQQRDTLQFNNAGIFRLDLQFEEIATGCRGQNSVGVQVQAYPDASFTTPFDNDAVVCANQQVPFTAAQNIPGTIYFWDFGNGRQLTEFGGLAAESYSQKGPVTVRLITQTTFGCSDTFSRNYTFVEPEGRLLAVPTTICKGDEVEFTVNNLVDVSSYRIEFGDGDLVENRSPARHIYDDFGNNGGRVARLFMLQDIGGGKLCPNSDSVFIRIINVVADFGANQSYCVGVPVTLNATPFPDADIFRWNFGDNTTSNLQNTTHTYTSAGTFAIKLVVQNQANGCKDSLTRTVRIDPNLTLSAFGDEICPGGTAEIGLNSPDRNWTISWAPAASVISSTAGVTKTRPLQNTTTFSVNVVDPSGCRGNANVTVTVGNTPLGITVTDNATICEGETAQIGVTNPQGTWTISWSNPSLLVNPTSFATQTDPLSATTSFRATVVDTITKCRDEKTITISILESSLTPDSIAIIAQKGQTGVQLPPLTGIDVANFNILWQPPVPCGNCPDPVVDIPEDTRDTVINYIAIVSDKTDCFRDTFLRPIRLIDLPNVFTPDGDGINDRFNVVLPFGVKAGDVVDFKIFNRWGNLVYENDDPTLGWDGTHKGKDAPSDVYIYIVNVRFSNEKEMQFKGDVTLLR